MSKLSGMKQRITDETEEFGTKVKTLKSELEKGGGIPRLRDLLLAESVLKYMLESMTSMQD